MRQSIILVIAAGLTWDHGKPALDSESRRVCEEAARLAKEISDAILYCTAGVATEYESVIMSRLMKEYLIKCGASPARTLDYCAPNFTTVGEARCFWESVLKEWRGDDYSDYMVYVVARSWHAPRVELVMWSTVPRPLLNHVVIRMVHAVSEEWHFEKRLEWLRWLKGFRHVMFGFWRQFRFQ